MSTRTKSASLVLVLTAFGVICIVLSLFAGWNLTEMINDQLGYHSDLIRLGAENARGNTVTLTAGPAERFLGAGLLGTYAPTALAVIGTLLLGSAFRTAKRNGMD